MNTINNNHTVFNYPENNNNNSMEDGKNVSNLSNKLQPCAKKINEFNPINNINPVSTPNETSNNEISDECKKMIEDGFINGVTKILIENNLTDPLIPRKILELCGDNSFNFFAAYHSLDKPQDLLILADVFGHLTEFETRLFVNVAEILPKGKRTIDEVMKFVNIKSSEEPFVSENYRVRVPNWGQSYNKADQLQYSKMMNRGVLIASAILEDHYRIDRCKLEDLMSFFGCYRRSIASQLNYSNSRWVGVLRENLSDGDVANTRCEGIYKNLEGDLRDLFRTLKPEKQPWIFEKNGDMHYELESQNTKIYSKTSWPSFINRITTIGDLKGEKVALSIVDIVDNMGDDDSDSVTVKHPNTVVAKKVMEHVSTLYEDVLKESDKEVLLEKLGGIFWWVCQAKPWAYGDPSIVELFIKTLWKLQTCSLLPPWKENLIPWCETVKNVDVNVFGKNFNDLFDHSFKQ